MPVQAAGACISALPVLCAALPDAVAEVLPAPDGEAAHAEHIPVSGTAALVSAAGPHISVFPMLCTALPGDTEVLPAPDGGTVPAEHIPVLDTVVPVSVSAAGIRI